MHQAYQLLDTNVMGRPLRMFVPGQIYFITQRTLQGRLLLRPSMETNAIVGGIIARAQSIFGVKIYGFVIMSNHLHLLLSSERNVIHLFMQWIASAIARKIGRLVEWPEKFWGRRYSAEPILDDEAAIGRLKYIFAHGVKEGLVEHSKEWPGLTCIPELTTGAVRTFHWVNGTSLAIDRVNGCTKDTKAYQIAHTLSVSRLPCFEDQDHHTFLLKMNALLSESECDGKQQRTTTTDPGNAVQKKRSLGAKVILRQNPHNKPKTMKRSPRPLCHTSCPRKYQEFKRTVAEFIATFREASKRLRIGDLVARFPEYAFRPPLPIGWIPLSVAT